MSCAEYHTSSSLPSEPFRRAAVQDPATWPASWTTLETKYTARTAPVPLPSAGLTGSLSDVLSARSSHRAGRGERWSTASLGCVLEHAVGVRRRVDDRPGDRRAYPSAGARFPIEIYLVSDGVSDAANVFHYSLVEHRLHGVRLVREPAAALRAAFAADWVVQAFGVVVLTAVLERSSRKYGERAYRYALLESGHLAQNLLLAAEACGVGAVPVGGFADRVLAAVVGADGERELVTYAVALT